MSKQEFSVLKLANRLQTEADAYLMLEELRWDGAPEACPKCGTVGRCYFLQPRDGSTGRKTRTGANTQRRVWKCGECRKQFSVLTDTIFHGTKISIRVWLLVIFEFVASKNSVSAWEISRKHEITNETAWHMLHRIREAMRFEPLPRRQRRTPRSVPDPVFIHVLALPGDRLAADAPRDWQRGGQAPAVQTTNSHHELAANQQVIAMIVVHDVWTVGESNASGTGFHAPTRDQPPPATTTQTEGPLTHHFRGRPAGSRYRASSKEARSL